MKRKLWAGKLHHSREAWSDWGTIRDEDDNLIMKIMLPVYDKDLLNTHRKNKTDPTQERVDFILNKLNG